MPERESRQDDAAQELLPEDLQGCAPEKADPAQGHILRSDIK